VAAPKITTFLVFLFTNWNFGFAECESTPYPQTKNAAFTNTASCTITRLSSTRIDYNAIDEQVNAVCTTRNFAYACWLLRDFSDQCEDTRLDDAHIFLLRDKREASQEHKRRITAELTVLFNTQNNSLTVERNLYLRLSLLYYFSYGNIRSYLVCSIMIKE
jgi:hypothetical protein